MIEEGWDRVAGSIVSRLVLVVLVAMAWAATANAAKADPGLAKLASTPNGPGPHLAEWQITTPAKERAAQVIVDDAMAKGAYDVVGVPDPAYHKLGKAGYLLAMFTKDTPLQPVPGAIVRQLPYTRAQYKAIFDGIYALALVPGTNHTRSYYAFAADIDPGTGKVSLRTDAPQAHIDILNHEFPGMLEITHGGPRAAAATAKVDGGGAGNDCSWWIGGSAALIAAVAFIARTRLRAGKCRSPRLRFEPGVDDARGRQTETRRTRTSQPRLHHPAEGGLHHPQGNRQAASPGDPRGHQGVAGAGGSPDLISLA